MSYLKLLNARRKNGQVPSMKQPNLSVQQKAWADEGLCIQCGQTPAAKHSFLCDPCQADDTIEEIRDEIAALRHKLMNKNE